MMSRNTTMMGSDNLQILKEKLLPFMSIHDTDHFQHDGALCHLAVWTWTLDSIICISVTWSVAWQLTGP